MRDETQHNIIKVGSHASTQPTIIFFISLKINNSTRIYTDVTDFHGFYLVISDE